MRGGEEAVGLKGSTMTKDVTLRHLLDLCRKNEKTGLWQYSAFLSPAEQDDWLRSPEAARFPFLLAGGYEGAERLDRKSVV